MRQTDDATSIFLGLSRLRGVGFKTLRDLGGIDAIATRFASHPLDFVESITHERQPADIEKIIHAAGKEAWEKISGLGIKLVRFSDKDFPVKFQNLESKSRPLWFFYRGNIEILSRPSVAVVGTRSPTLTGEFLARYAVTALKELNAPVVSGLAKGIDEVAHEWALTCDLPTISVLGNGLMKTYPPKNADLADRIVKTGGLLISEYLPHAQPSAENFVWRNRLQAALAQCVIAPEWKRSSGTAHTIRYAQRMGRKTINLQLPKKALPEDHGVADLNFEVPTEHYNLIEALLGSGVNPNITDQCPPSSNEDEEGARQKSLF